MTNIIIIIGAVLVVLGIYRFFNSNEHKEELPEVVPTQEEIENAPVVEEEPVVVVNNIVVETKTETPKAKPVAETPAKAPAKKKPYRKPKPKTPAATTPK
jgi:hypothetical protein